MKIVGQNGKVLFEDLVDSVVDTLVNAVKTGADLSGADLSGADLSGAYLREADLRKANLSRADLRRADLYRADLQGADLQGADLRGTSLYGANLSGADLTRANLFGANLAGAGLFGANLTWADLYGADLQGADLTGANLTGADLRGANLFGANLAGADLTNLKHKHITTVIAKTRILPEGSVIGWKKCDNAVIVKLRIPEEAKRSHAFGRRCRAEFADVLEVIGAEVGITSKHGPKTCYEVGKRVYPDSWDEDWMKECSSGIHFFITRPEAEEWT